MPSQVSFPDKPGITSMCGYLAKMDYVRGRINRQEKTVATVIYSPFMRGVKSILAAVVSQIQSDRYMLEGMHDVQRRKGSPARVE